MIRNTWIRLWDFPVAFRFGQALLLNNIRFFDTGYRMYYGCLWFPLNGISALKHGICIRSTIASKTLDIRCKHSVSNFFRTWCGMLDCLNYPPIVFSQIPVLWLCLTCFSEPYLRITNVMAQNASFCWKPAHNKKTKKQSNKTKNHEWCTQKSDFQTRPS